MKSLFFFFFAFSALGISHTSKPEQNMSSNIYTHSEACENPHTNLKGCIFRDRESDEKGQSKQRPSRSFSLFDSFFLSVSLWLFLAFSLSLCFDINSLLSPIRNPSCQSIHVLWHCLRPIGLIFLFLSFSLSVYLISAPGMYTHTHAHISVYV